MDKYAPGPWHVMKNRAGLSVMGADSSVVAVLPEREKGDGLRIREAYLLATAPELFEVCCKINSILENSFIVTPEGFKINCTDIKKSLIDAILRAVGCRKSQNEP